MQHSPMRHVLILLGLVCFAPGSGTSLRAQEPASADVPVRVDEQGVMRWTADGE